MSETITGKVELSMSVKQCHCFSGQPLKAAEYFAKRAEEIESSTSSPFQEIESKLRAYVTGTILLTVVELESFIKELHFDAQKNQNALKKRGLDENKISLLGQDCREFKQSFSSTLPKYQKALELIGAEKFDEGQYQDTQSLIYLRNAIVHYKPEFDNEPDRHNELKERLNEKFKECKFYQQSNALWFPHKCLGSGCAEWSVNTVKNFMSEFCKRAGISL